MGLVCAAGGALLVLLAAAALLKVAVSVTNGIVGPAKAKPRGGGIAEWDWDDWDDEYDEPARPRWGAKAIPEPGLGTCVVVVFATAFAAGLGFVLLGFAAEAVGLRMRREETKLAVAVVDLPFAGLALSTMLVAMLPTTFWRAAMVAFVYAFLLFGLALTVGAAVFVLAAVFD